MPPLSDSPQLTLRRHWTDGQRVFDNDGRYVCALSDTHHHMPQLLQHVYREPPTSKANRGSPLTDFEEDYLRRIQPGVTT